MRRVSWLRRSNTTEESLVNGREDVLGKIFNVFPRLRASLEILHFVLFGYLHRLLVADLPVFSEVALVADEDFHDVGVRVLVDPIEPLMFLKDSWEVRSKHRITPFAFL